MRDGLSPGMLGNIREVLGRRRANRGEHPPNDFHASGLLLVPLAFHLAVAALLLWVLYAYVSPAFTPLRAELTDARGFSRGLLNFVVLPARVPYPHVAAWWMVLTGVLWLSLLSFPTYRLGIIGLLTTVAEPLALLVLFAAVLAPSVASYRIVFAERTFVLLALVLAASRLTSVWARISAQWPFSRTMSRRLSVVAAATLATGFFVSLMIQGLSRYGGNYSGFLHISHEVAATAPFLAERPELAHSLLTAEAGYDGQFMYLIAFDPFLQRFGSNAATYRRVVDDPPYRYGRIGFPLLTRFVAGMSPVRYPAVMVWLTVLAHIPLALTLAILASWAGRSPFAGLAYLAIPSFIVSTSFALPEGIAAAGLVAGFAFSTADRFVLACLCFVVSLLVRETGIVFLLPLTAAVLMRSRRGASWLIGSLFPLATWRTFVAARLFNDFRWHAVFANPGDFGAPFAGLTQLVHAGLVQTQAAPETLAAITFPVVLCLAFGVALAAFSVRWGPLEIAAVLYGLIAISLNYQKIWMHVPSGERGVFELFIVLLLLGLEERGQHPWLHRSYLTAFFALAVYTLVLSPEASISRAALLLIR